jgi:hypothetical protein
MAAGAQIPIFERGTLRSTIGEYSDMPPSCLRGW